MGAINSLRLNKSHSQGLQIEIEHFKKVCSGNQMREALKAFKERRKPVFTKSS
jgi:hypothetical protein